MPRRTARRSGRPARTGRGRPTRPCGLGAHGVDEAPDQQLGGRVPPSTNLRTDTSADDFQRCTRFSRWMGASRSRSNRGTCTRSRLRPGKARARPLPRQRREKSCRCRSMKISRELIQRICDLQFVMLGVMQPSKVLAKTLSAGFHRIIQRVLATPGGSRDRVSSRSWSAGQHTVRATRLAPSSRGLLHQLLGRYC